jgi:hypothetical protein
MRQLQILLGSYLLAGCGGQVVAIKMPQHDPNPSAHYTCTPEGKSGFACESRQTFHQYDREVEVSRQHCAVGVNRVYVETDWRGNVTRIQYTCGTLPSGEFPKE